MAMIITIAHAHAVPAWGYGIQDNTTTLITTDKYMQLKNKHYIPL